MIETAIERANVKKLALQKSEAMKSAPEDLEYKIGVKEKEIVNANKQIKLNETELTKLNEKFNQLVSADEIRKLEEQLRQVQAQKKTLLGEITACEQTRNQQHKNLDEFTNTDKY